MILFYPKNTQTQYDPTTLVNFIFLTSSYIGVTVLVDSKALITVLGSEMDYVEDKLSSQFVFHNPNAKGVCGCGESFAV